jgi:hypothetical protein
VQKLIAFLLPYSDAVLIGSVLVISAVAALASVLCTSLLPGGSEERPDRPLFSGEPEDEMERDRR